MGAILCEQRRWTKRKRSGGDEMAEMLTSVSDGLKSEVEVVKDLLKSKNEQFASNATRKNLVCTIYCMY
jgi:hypothetical protein